MEFVGYKTNQYNTVINPLLRLGIYRFILIKKQLQSTLACLRTLCPHKKCVKIWEIVKIWEVPIILTILAVFWYCF